MTEPGSAAGEGFGNPSALHPRAGKLLCWGFLFIIITNLQSSSFAFAEATTHLGSSRIPPTDNGATFKLVLAIEPEGHQVGRRQSRDKTSFFLDVPLISSSCRLHHWLWSKQTLPCLLKRKSYCRKVLGLFLSSMNKVLQFLLKSDLRNLQSGYCTFLGNEKIWASSSSALKQWIEEVKNILNSYTVLRFKNVLV